MKLVAVIEKITFKKCYEKVMQNQSTRFRYECARTDSLELFKYKISPGRGISFPRDFPFRNINDSFYTDTFSTLILQSISILENFLNVSRIC